MKKCKHPFTHLNNIDLYKAISNPGRKKGNQRKHDLLTYYVIVAENWKIDK